MSLKVSCSVYTFSLIKEHTNNVGIAAVKYAFADTLQLELLRNSCPVRCGLMILGSRSAGWEVE